MTSAPLAPPVRSPRCTPPKAGGVRPVWVASPRVSITTGQVIAAYLAERTPSKSPSSQRGDRLYARIIGAEWDGLPVEGISPAFVDRMLRQIGEERGPVLANRCRYFISQICKHAERLDARPANSNPTTSALRFREVVTTEFLHEHERAALIDAVRRLAGDQVITVQAGVLVLLMALAGVRWSEARELRWDEVDLRHGVLRFRPRGEGRAANKSGNERTVPVTDDVLDLLRGLPRGGTWVAPNPATSLPYTDLRCALDHVAAAIGVERLRCHKLRHSFGTACAEAGLTTQQIACLLGQTSEHAAYRYIHLTGGAMRGVLGAVAARARGRAA